SHRDRSSPTASPERWPRAPRSSSAPTSPSRSPARPDRSLSTAPNRERSSSASSSKASATRCSTCCRRLRRRSVHAPAPLPSATCDAAFAAFWATVCPSVERVPLAAAIRGGRSEAMGSTSRTLPGEKNLIVLPRLSPRLPEAAEVDLDELLGLAEYVLPVRC